MKWILLTLGFASVSAHAEPKIVELAISSYSTCALLDNKKVKCWGDGYYGGTGSGNAGATGDTPDEMGEALGYVDLGTDLLVEKLYSGDYSVCAKIANSGKLKCWGYGIYGTLANGTNRSAGNEPNQMGDKLKYADLGNFGKIIDADGGDFHFCALSESRKVKCWGYNNSGQLGLGDFINRGDNPNTIGDKLPFVDLGTVSKPKKLSLGRYHSCALFENKKVKCWGFNANSQLGLGDSRDRGGQAGEMGDKLPFLNLGSEGVIDISAASAHTCALFESGRIKCWGNNAVGQLGLGNNSEYGSKPEDMGDNLPWAGLIDSLPATGIFTSGGHSCARFLNATIKCWGLNTYGQLGLGHRTPVGDEPAETGDGLDFIYLGRNASVGSISLSNTHTCATVYRKGVYQGVKCWGYGYYGGLGQGDRIDYGAAPEDMPNLPFIKIGK